jgi:hypothetical protein
MREEKYPLEKIDGSYQWLVVTEECPKDLNFKPNIDIATGSGTRLNYRSFPSGVDLDTPPFCLSFIEHPRLQDHHACLPAQLSRVRYQCNSSSEFVLPATPDVVVLTVENDSVVLLINLPKTVGE